MIDTIRLESPPLDGWTLQEFVSHLETRMAIDNLTGEPVYEFVSGGLNTSADYRVRLEVREFRWESYAGRPGLKARPEKVDCHPFVILEASAHKAMMKHNVFGGPVCPHESARYLVGTVADALAIDLPDGSEWLVSRVDNSHVYDMGSFGTCSDFVSTMNQARYPRRKTRNWNGESIAFPGTMTYAKIYHKGPEFAKCDRKRLQSHLHGSIIDELQEAANTKLRVEIELKSKKLKADFGHLPRAAELTASYLDAVYDREIARIMQEGTDTMRIVRRNKEVRERLQSLHGDRLASVLFGTWMQLATLGDDEVRNGMKRSTYYLQRKQLRDAGISWFGTNVIVTDSAIPEGFSFQRGSQWHCSGESIEVQKALLPYRVAV